MPQNRHDLTYRLKGGEVCSEGVGGVPGVFGDASKDPDLGTELDKLQISNQQSKFVDVGSQAVGDKPK